jgi:hypothetical protein
LTSECKSYDAAKVNLKETPLQNPIPPAVHLPADIDGRICFRLAELGLSRWTAPIRDWRDRFQGMERWLAPAHRMPTLTILGLLGRYGRARACMGDEKVASDLARLDFTYWQARWPRWVTQGEPMRWQPLHAAFSEFEQHFLDERAPQVWVSDTPVVAPALASSHLLGLLPDIAPSECSPVARNVE